MKEKPLLIAHRGASGELPEHTLAAYERAAERGADYLEPDLVSTKDGVLVCRHENEISGTTDIAKRPQFATRKTTKRIDGISFTGWFTEDFTWDELKAIRCRERLPAVRPGNATYDGKFPLVRFEDLIALAKRLSKKYGRTIGVYPETKHPSYFKQIGLALEPVLVRVLKEAGWTTEIAPVFIQSFEKENLKQLRRMTGVRLISLIDTHPTPAELKELAQYAYGIGPTKGLVIPVGADGALTKPTSLVQEAHAAGLKVHPWTFRRENQFLPKNLRRGNDPNAPGDMAAELRAFVEAGIDGLFSDNPAEVAEYLQNR
ncbi:MAG: glycerophosphodiester phosphodiesterase [Armatimonas sp.]